MALWLCRLESDDLTAVGRDDDRARRFGIGAWVLPVQVTGKDRTLWESIGRCFALQSGLPLLMEWVIDRPCTLAEEQALAEQLPPPFPPSAVADRPVRRLPRPARAPARSRANRLLAARRPS